MAHIAPPPRAASPVTDLVRHVGVVMRVVIVDDQYGLRIAIDVQRAVVIMAVVAGTGREIAIIERHATQRRVINLGQQVARPVRRQLRRTHASTRGGNRSVNRRHQRLSGLLGSQGHSQSKCPGVPRRAQGTTLYEDDLVLIRAAVRLFDPEVVLESIWLEPQFRRIVSGQRVTKREHNTRVERIKHVGVFDDSGPAIRFPPGVGVQRIIPADIRAARLRSHQRGIVGRNVVTIVVISDEVTVALCAVPIDRVLALMVRTGQCRQNRRHTRDRLQMTQRAVTHDSKSLTMATQTVVRRVLGAVPVGIGIGHSRDSVDRRPVQHMVLIGHDTVVAHAAGGLSRTGIRDRRINHTNVLKHGRIGSQWIRILRVLRQRCVHHAQHHDCRSERYQNSTMHSGGSFRGRKTKRDENVLLQFLHVLQRFALGRLGMSAPVTNAKTTTVLFAQSSCEEQRVRLLSPRLWDAVCETHTLDSCCLATHQIRTKLAPLWKVRIVKLTTVVTNITDRQSVWQQVGTKKAHKNLLRCRFCAEPRNAVMHCAIEMPLTSGPILRRRRLLAIQFWINRSQHAIRKRQQVCAEEICNY